MRTIKIGSFKCDDIEFSVWKSGPRDYWISCQYCGLVELEGWDLGIQCRAKDVIMEYILR